MAQLNQEAPNSKTFTLILSMHPLLDQILAFCCAIMLLIGGWRFFRRLAGAGLFLASAGVVFWLLGRLGLEFGAVRMVLAGLAGVAAVTLLSRPLFVRWGALLMNFALILGLRYLAVENGMLGESSANHLTGFLGGLAILSSFISVGALSGLLFAFALQVPYAAGWQFFAILGACFAVAWLRHGRLPATSVATSPSVVISALAGRTHDNPVRVKLALSFDAPQDLRAFGRLAERHDWPFDPVESLLCATVEMPVARAAWVQRMGHFLGLFSLGTPAVVDRADAAVNLHPIPDENLYESASAISLEEIRKRLRTNASLHRLPEGKYNGEGAHVAILDTGGERRPEYDAVTAERVSFVPGESVDDLNSSRHGSNCGMIVHAMAPAARLSFVKVLSNAGAGQLQWIINAYKWCVENRIDAISASYGGCACKGASTCISCRSGEALRRNGVAFIASAGNSGPGTSTIGCPGGSRGAIAVAAADREGRISRFSSRGPSLDPGNPKPDVTAYGESVLLRTTRNGPNQQPMNGTSFSCPQVSGLAAILIGIMRQRNPRQSRKEIEPIVRRALLQGCRQDTLAVGHRHPHAAGKGMICIASSVAQLDPQGVKDPSVSTWLPWLVRRATIPAAACLGLFFLRATVVDSVSTLEESGSERAVRLVGRVVESSSGRVLLEDGTGAIYLMVVDASVVPRPGSLVFLSGVFQPHLGHVVTHSQLLLANSRSPKNQRKE